MNILFKLVRVLALVAACTLVAHRSIAQYTQLNLTGFQSGMGHYVDPLLNGWGMAQAPDGPFCVADAATGVATFYDRSGKPLPTVITVPSASGGPTGVPSGLVYNPTKDFVITKGRKSAPARFIFSTLDGGIAGWNPAVDPNNAVLMFSKADASYPGLALGQNSHGQNILYAANWGATPQFEMFDGSFSPAGSFTDPAVAAEYATYGPVPFGADFDSGKLYVTFAMAQASPLEFGGVVDVFDGDGNLLTPHHFAANAPGAGPLDNPWAIVRAPADFGPFANALLIGNVEGPGYINAFAATGAFLGSLTDSSGEPLAIAGLWELIFPHDNPGAGKSNPLFFTAGPNAVTFTGNGLFGDILPSR
jgi:uncharacterized protein (TIGR03118 family)